MNAKERLQATLNHKQPDKVCIDFGSTPVTGIHVLVVDKLRAHYGLQKRPVKVTEPYQMLGEVDNELREIMGIDTIGVQPLNNMFGFANEGWKPFTIPWGQDVLVPGQFNVSKADDGSLLMHPEGDLQAPPSAKMPASGYFFDAIIRQQPIDESKLNAEDNLEEFSEIADSDLDYFEQECLAAAKTGKGIVANFGGTGLGDIALVPAMNLKQPKGIRDVAEWYMSTMMRQDYIHEIFDRQTNIALKNLDKLNRRVGHLVDVVFMCGTDFGTQDSQFCSPESFESLWAPYYKRMNDWIHQNTGWKTFKHSCGAIIPLLDQFIDAGFDIINPVQVNAAGMDPKLLKERWGGKVTFWGGGVDTQKALPFGTPEQVREQVMRHCELFGQGGGYVFNTVHNIQANTPIKNVVALFEALKEVNR